MRAQRCLARPTLPYPASHAEQANRIASNKLDAETHDQHKQVFAGTCSSAFKSMTWLAGQTGQTPRRIPNICKAALHIPA